MHAKADRGAGQPEPESCSASQRENLTHKTLGKTRMQTLKQKTMSALSATPFSPHQNPPASFRPPFSLSKFLSTLSIAHLFYSCMPAKADLGKVQLERRTEGEPATHS